MGKRPHTKIFGVQFFDAPLLHHLTIPEVVVNALATCEAVMHYEDTWIHLMVRLNRTDVSVLQYSRFVI